MGQRSPIFKFNYLLPYGAIVRPRGVQFSVVSRHATKMKLLLYDRPEAPDPTEVIEFNPRIHRWGDVWTVYLDGIAPGALYHFQADGPFDPQNGLRFDGSARLIDPYAKALCGAYLPSEDGIVRPPKCVVVSYEFDWAGEPHIRRDLADSIIYELHVRGFTGSPTSGVEHPGTYRGVIEKIPYLKSLGVTTIELMPVHEFPTNESNGKPSPRSNYWGYDPMAFFAPHRGYACSPEPGAQVREFKEMVLELHKAGLEVILDVVFNHTAEGNENGPTFSFKGLGNRSYYLLGPNGEYRNYSGCGNTVNGNHPLVRELIFSCLRYWVHNFHVDGFRFDLASILSRDRSGNLVANPPVLETIAEDPMLAETKIIAEAWDAAGAYQVGSFGSQRWAEWNGRFRDDVRRFWRGDYGMTSALATRVSGSSDLYLPSGRSPESSINFITSHDGFTLADLVSYREKHNDANGEGNRDGDNNNNSENFGVEGPTKDAEILKLRARQVRNFFATLLLSQGVPMMVAGDEFGRTQNGNNNAWCQDGPVSWLDWSLVDKRAGLLRFVRTLLALRRREPTLRRRQFLTGRPLRPGLLPDVSWFGAAGGQFDWNGDHSGCLTILLDGDDSRNDVVPGGEIGGVEQKTAAKKKGAKEDKKAEANGKTKSSLIDSDDSAEDKFAKFARPETVSAILAPTGRPTPFHLLAMLNPSGQRQTFSFPAAANRENYRWRLGLDSAALPPRDAYPYFDGPRADPEAEVVLEPHSIRVWLAPIEEEKGESSAVVTSVAEGEIPDNESCGIRE